MDARVVLIGKPDCHLCENARLIVSRVFDELSVNWTELSILDDPKLADKYFESIPVLIVDGKHVDQFRVDEARLRSAILGS
jgi:glutaredoxin